MTFFSTLQQQTVEDKQLLHAIPIIQRAVKGQVSRDQYIAFLIEAYHHVKYTVPLLMACGARLPERLEWLRVAIGEYIEEEMGHQEWILNDLSACGVDSDTVRHSRPSMDTDIMVAYAFDTIQRHNPVGFLGMVYVLEGTSIELAEKAAKTTQASTDLPDTAFTYLVSHGGLDQQHIVFFQSLVDRLELESDRLAVLHNAQVFFHLYGNIFRGIENTYDRKAA